MQCRRFIDKGSNTESTAQSRSAKSASAGKASYPPEAFLFLTTRYPKLAAVPALILIVLSALLARFKISLGSVSLFVGIAVAMVFAAIQFVKEKNKLKRKEEMQRLEAIAAGMSYEQVLAIEKAQKADESGEKTSDSAEETGVAADETEKPEQQSES